MTKLAIALAILLLPLAARAAEPTATPYGLPALERADFNRLAAAAFVPLFWAEDAENQGQLDPAELVHLHRAADVAKFVKGGAFTPGFEVIYRGLVEDRRREAVERELSQGRPTLVLTDLTDAPIEDRKIMGPLLEVAQLVDELYREQLGAGELSGQVPPGDEASRALFARNHGPWCEAPETEGEPFCNAVPTFPDRHVSVYPRDAVVNRAFCELLAAEPNAERLLDPFTVVRRAGEGFEALPYTAVYGKRMQKVAARLRAAAAGLGDDEKAFRRYLEAAAKAFETNEWEPADEAWAAMSAENSRWYLRVAPDETYWEPCQRKAGFHVSLARVDAGALEWQRRLTEVRADMEGALAALIGPPYVARDVRFQLPDFINIVTNAGDSRSALGATIGQSLPNFGKVAEEGRGRTVAMINLYTDPDSLEKGRRVAESLFTPETAVYLSDDVEMSRLDTVLHEATHNLGPYGSTRVDGKLPEEIFGGRTDAILEELKAQTGSLYFIAFLGQRKLLSDEQVRRGWVGAIAWAFGHIARGMVAPSGQPKTYSQVSAIQLGELMRAGAIRFVEGGDGPDPGRFDIDFEAMPAAIDAMMAKVGRIKATADVNAASELITRSVGDEGLEKIHAALIAERVLRYPKATFVYSIRF